MSGDSAISGSTFITKSSEFQAYPTKNLSTWSDITTSYFTKTMLTPSY